MLSGMNDAIKTDAGFKPFIRKGLRKTLRIGIHEDELDTGKEHYFMMRWLKESQNILCKKFNVKNPSEKMVARFAILICPA